MSNNEIAERKPSVVEQNEALRERFASVTESVVMNQSWIERKFKPKTINARYPIKGATLLFATCGFGSLGDALFGYNSGNFTDAHVSTHQLT